MKQKLQAILDDDRGVSPVIGVILMVAITVILAAVIGTFVLGLGDSLNQAPQATLNADSSSVNTMNISHDGGDGFAASDADVIIDGDRTSFSNASGFSGDFQVGDTAEFSSDLDDIDDFSGEVRVRVIHTPSESVLMDQTVDVPN